MPALSARLGLWPFDPRCLYVTSPWFSPAVLAGLRLLLAVWTTVTIIVELVRGAKDGSNSGFFSYFTHLSYVGVTAYFWAAGVQTLAYARRSPSTHQDVHRYPLQHWGKTLQFLHILLGATVFVFPIIVTAVFWSLLASPGTLRDTAHAWENISVHALNTALAGFEMLLTNTPPPPALYVFAVFLCLAGYLGVAYVTYATQGFYTYSFLDPKKEKGKLAAYIVGIGAAGFIIFGLASLVVFARQALVRALVKRGTLRDRTAPLVEKDGMGEGTQMQNVAQGSARGSRVSVVGLPGPAAAGAAKGSVEKRSLDV